MLTAALSDGASASAVAAPQQTAAEATKQWLLQMQWKVRKNRLQWLHQRQAVKRHAQRLWRGLAAKEREAPAAQAPSGSCCPV